MLFESVLENLLYQELLGDAAFNDETTDITINETWKAQGRVTAKQPGVFSGASLCQALASISAASIKCTDHLQDGSPFRDGETLACFVGSARTLLSVERTLLNFLMHLCGIATLTREYVRALEGTSTRLLATRKTLPGLRQLGLAAVVHGGGLVHRRSLSDGVLIKENHLVFTGASSALRSARDQKSPLHHVEIEVQSLDELENVIELKPDMVLLDNFEPAQVKEAVNRIGGRTKVEVSGGITLSNIRNYALQGVDFISVGRITHSAPACDLSLDVCPIH